MLVILFVAVFLATTALIRWEQRRGIPRAPRPAHRTRPALAVLALLTATVVLGVIDPQPVVQVVVLAALVLVVTSGRDRDAASPQ